MKLVDVIKTMMGDEFSLPKKVGDHVSTQGIMSVYVMLMGSDDSYDIDEPYITCNVESLILVPWYDCEVQMISPTVEENTIQVWLKDAEYLVKNYSQYIKE